MQIDSRTGHTKNAGVAEKPQIVSVGDSLDLQTHPVWMWTEGTPKNPMLLHKTLYSFFILWYNLLAMSKRVKIFGGDPI